MSTSFRPLTRKELVTLHAYLIRYRDELLNANATGAAMAVSGVAEMVWRDADKPRWDLGRRAARKAAKK